MGILLDNDKNTNKKLCFFKLRRRAERSHHSSSSEKCVMGHLHEYRKLCTPAILTRNAHHLLTINSLPVLTPVGVISATIVANDRKQIEPFVTLVKDPAE